MMLLRAQRYPLLPAPEAFAPPVIAADPKPEVRSGLAIAARVCASERPWMITVPPVLRAFSKLARVSRSPVDTN